MTDNVSPISTQVADIAPQVYQLFAIEHGGTYKIFYTIYPDKISDIREMYRFDYSTVTEVQIQMPDLFIQMLYTLDFITCY